MGWTGIRNTGQTLREVINYEFGAGNILGITNNVDTPLKNGHREVFAACHSQGSGNKFILCILFEAHNGELLWKEMDEGMHPFYYNCPAWLIDLCDEVEIGSNAWEWRMKTGWRPDSTRRKIQQMRVTQGNLF